MVIESKRRSKLEMKSRKGSTEETVERQSRRESTEVKVERQ